MGKTITIQYVLVDVQVFKWSFRNDIYYVNKECEEEFIHAISLYVETQSSRRHLLLRRLDVHERTSDKT